MLTMPRAEPLAEALGLGVEAGAGGHTVAEQAVDQHVDAVQVGQREDLDVEVLGLGQQVADPVDGRELAQPLGTLGRGVRRSRTHRPRLASPPLSPDRACTNVPERHPPGDRAVG